MHLARCCLLVALICVLSGVCLSCNLGSINFEHQTGVIWDVKERETVSGSVVTYLINPCLVQGPICSDYVCKIHSLTNHSAIGLKDLQPVITNNTAEKEVRVQFTGDTCPVDPSETLKIFILFRCGKTLGSPVLLDNLSPCNTYFEWETDLACVNPPTVNEIKCYVHDQLGRKIDLSPLVKTRGSYSVTSSENMEINVCRDITISGQETGCAACFNNDDGTTIKVGQVTVTHPLQLDTSGKPYMEYTSNTTQTGCTSYSATHIRFHCPPRGDNKDPRLVSSENCQYIIEWETEFACFEDFSLIRGPQCGFTMDAHQVDIDLTSLRKAGEPYLSTWGPNRDDTKNYTYVLNICGDLGSTDCGDPHVAACQIDPTTGSKHALGTTDHQLLRYSDGSLSLTYGGGESCHTGFHRTTVIKFECGTQDELGFSDEDECTYIFYMKTPAFCPDKAEKLQCRVTHGNKVFDLSRLRKLPSEDDWEAQQEESSSNQGLIYLNVCEELTRSGTTSRCPAGAAACMIPSGDGEVLSLGEYGRSPLVYLDAGNTLQLHYSHGSPCAGGSHMETIIRFKCLPGHTLSNPVVYEKSEDGCIYKIEWSTSFACVLGNQTGTQCKVEDPDQGYMFDLSPMTKTGDSAYYFANSSNSIHDYYLNVCGEVKGTACSGSDQTHNSTAVCQVDRENPNQIHNTGQPNGNLKYFDGVVTLNYVGGDPYHGNPIHYRQTEIDFLCDPKAGVGTPEFTSETAKGYSFLWYTEYVCPRRSVECSVVDPNTHQQYDLSGLARVEEEENWVAVDQSHPSVTKKMYINLCQPAYAVNVGSGCEDTAGVCITQTIGSSTEEMRIRNAGQALSPPEIHSHGELVLRYTNGSACTESDSTPSAYSTIVYLHCDKTHSHGSDEPQFRGRSGNCQFEVDWWTPSACPRAETHSDTPCIITDPASDFTFNLNPLKSTSSYSVNDDGQMYEFNICGPLGQACGQDGLVGVCKDGEAIATASSNLTLTETGDLFLNYGHTGTDQYRVHFICNQSVVHGQPILHKDDHLFTINLETSLACLPEIPLCHTFDDEGNEYDLSGLAMASDNWQVVDSREGLIYYINICHELNPRTGTGAWCEGNMLGGCQLDSSNKAHNMGYIQSEPIATSKNTISIHYLGGEICHKGRPNESHRSTHIILTCAEEEQDPVFREETDLCEYTILWSTKHACPIQRDVGNNCAVTDPVNNAVYDLSSLKKQPYYSINGPGTNIVHINLCGNITDSSSGCDQNTGACLIDGTTNTGYGAGRDDLTYRDGQLQLVYTDASATCSRNNRPRTTTIDFRCNSTTDGSSGPKFIRNDTCGLYYSWPTSLACPPVQSGECTIRDAEGKQYDLRRLSKPDGNYMVRSDSKVYVINVCSPLAPETDLSCPANSAACLVNPTATDPTKKFMRIGMLSEHPLEVTENGDVILTYPNTLCAGGSTGFTRIRLQCKEDAFEALPQHTFDEDQCKFNFIWETAAACPVREQMSSNCTVKDPDTGRIIDLNVLARPSGYSATDHKGHDFNINICSKLEHSPCGTNSGSCQVDTADAGLHWNAGDANSALSYEDRVATLEYTGGELCHHNMENRSTIIDFVCDRGLGELEFVYEGDDDCSYHFMWPTNLLCNEEIICLAESSGNVFDLTPLANGDGHYMASNQVSSGSVYINVCGPLRPILGVHCPASASACLVTPGIMPQVLSLGRTGALPQVDPVSQHVVLVYDHGSPCAETGRFWKTTVHFICERGPSLGIPSVKAIDESACEYMLEWKTNVVCPADTKPLPPDHCTYTDSRTQAIYDFSALTRSGSSPSYKVPGSPYTINICGAVTSPHTGCSHSAVCSVINDAALSYGAPESTSFIHEGPIIKMALTNGSSCPSQAGRTRSAYILFECDRAGEGSPELSSGDSCVVVFSWKTVHACPPVVMTCAFTHNAAYYDITALSSTQGNWQTVDQAGNHYWINVCHGVSGAPDGCHGDSAACMQSKDGTTVVSLGMTNTQRMSWSDSPSGIVIEYSKGSTSACSNGREAQTHLILTCSSGFGSPAFIKMSEENGCTFYFEWTTSLACEYQRAPAVVNGWRINDTATGQIFDLTQLGIDKTHSVPDAASSFLINLHQSIGKGCPEHTAVCRLDSQNQALSVGDTGKMKFYVRGSELEAEFQTDKPCSMMPKRHVSSIIVFFCNSSKDQSLVIRSTSSCEYIFDWYTPAACPVSDGTGKRDAGSGHVHSSLIIVLVLCSLLLITIILIFIKRERRRRFEHWWRGLLTKRTENGMRYSQLSALADGDDIGDLEQNTLLRQTTSPSSEYGISQQGNIQKFNDDSDEDMLL